MAEAHPVGFRWVMKAKEHGATIIHVDPRFSRTSALADIWVPIRAGSDIVFLGGLIRHLIEHNLYFREYVVHYTNASCILSDEYRDPEDNGDGYFSGWNEEKRAYEGDSWVYKGGDLSRPQRDLTLQDPQCVFQKLKRHFSRYTPEMVEKICGIPPDTFSQGRDIVSLLHLARREPRRFATQSAGRSIPKECRSFALLRFCNCCLEISADPAAEFSPCAVMPQSRARLIFRRCTTFCPAISRCRGKAMRLFRTISITTPRKPASGRITPKYLVSSLKGLLWEKRDSGKRFRLWLSSETHRQPFLLRISLRHARRKNGGHVSDGTKSSRRRAELSTPAKSVSEIEMACCPRDGRDRICKFLARIT